MASRSVFAAVALALSVSACTATTEEEVGTQSDSISAATCRLGFEGGGSTALPGRQSDEGECRRVCRSESAAFPGADLVCLFNGKDVGKLPHNCGVIFQSGGSVFALDRMWGGA